MQTETKIQKARFDAKLTVEQKNNFEYAASIGGYRTLTDFIILAAQEKANQIIKEHKNFLESKRDKEIFFNALLNPQEPNNQLLNAAKYYNDILNK